MTVDPHTAKHRAEYRGRPYYFCSAGCKTKFTADPQKYLSEEQASRSRSRRARCTPARCIREIRQVGPGACPICGMALEPEIATAETGPNAELVDMTRRFWIGLALALPVMVSR